MLRFRSSFINGVQNLIFNHGFRQLTLYSTSSNSTKVNPNFVNYLVETLGLSEEQAVLTSSRCNRKHAKEVSDYHLIKNANSVISYLQKIGLQQSHIRNAVHIHPLILLCSVEKTLNPKFKLFLKLGFFKPDVAEAVNSNSEFINSKQTCSTSLKKGSSVDNGVPARRGSGEGSTSLKSVNRGAENVSSFDLVDNNYVDKTITPYEDALLKFGFSERDIDALVSANPYVQLANLDTAVATAIQSLKEIMGSEERQVIPILNKLSYHDHSLYLVPNFMVPNVAFLQSCGVPIDAIRHYLFRRPYAFVSDTEKFQNTVTRVEEILGVPPNTPQFLVGVEVFPYFKDANIKSKMQVYRSYGWSDSDIVIHLLSSHKVLPVSKDKIKKKLEFLMNNVGYEPTYLVSKHRLFTASLNNKLVPRHKALEVLKENGLIREDYDLWTVRNYTNSQFLDEFVLPYEEVHKVYFEHGGMSLKKLRSLKPKSSAV